MASPSEIYFDAAIERQINVRRFIFGEVRAIRQILERSDRELSRFLRERLPNIRPNQLRALLREVDELREARHSAFKERLRRNLRGFSEDERDAELALLLLALPGSRFRRSSVSTVAEFQGRSLGQWFQGLLRVDRQRIHDAIRLGVAQGETVSQVLQRVSGSRTARFRDGATAMSRRQAEALARTLFTHLSNEAREAFWNANPEGIVALRWTSVLDGRTSAICRARDGKMAPFQGKSLPDGADPLNPPDARPPAHFNCRSVMVAVISGEIDELPTYNEWLNRQTSQTQDRILGKAKAKLFRDGKLKMDQFVDEVGRELTLDELRLLHPAAARAAGI